MNKVGHLWLFGKVRMAHDYRMGIRKVIGDKGRSSVSRDLAHMDIGCEI